MTRFPHYIITTDQDNLTKDSRGYVAKVKSDSSGLAFTVCDARGYSSVKANKGLRDIATVVFNKDTMPHDMKVAIRLKTVPDDSQDPVSDDLMRDLITDSANVLIVRNKPIPAAPSKFFLVI
jgi:hypothetical protein